MFETAQQVKQPVGMTMALQVQGSMYYKLGLYDQALTSLEKGIAICPTYENGENQVLYISAVLYEWLFMTALKVNDTERISRYADSYAALVKLERRAWESGPDRTLSRHLPLSPSLVFPEKTGK